MAQTQTETAHGTYVYAVTTPAPSDDVLKQISGINDEKVYTVASDDLVAVVSDVPSGDELRPERKNVSAHQRVLGRVTESCPVILPFAFGTIAESNDNVRALLQRYHDDLSGQLQHVKGMVEMVVRLWYSSKSPSLFEYLVSQRPELKQLREQLTGAGRVASREDKIDLGQRFASVLEDTRKEFEEKLKDALSKKGGEIKHTDPRNDEELARVACLLPKERAGDLQSAVNEAAKLFPDECSIELTGPFPPYDFIDLHLQAWTH